jgi:peptide/nickel transport system ATP-binding protein
VSAPATGAAADLLSGDAEEPLLRVRDLTVGFRTEDGPVSAVDHVSFDARAGELLAVVGESGCGKSVAAMALSGLLARNATVSGSVRLGGRELVGASPDQLRAVRGKEIAYIFQEPMTSLNPVFTVGRQVAEVLRVHEGMSRTQALDRAVELLDLVGIPHPRERLRQYPHQLSGGLRQRVMIAMAVACDPRVLVADEPTTALDVTVQAGILDVLRDLRDRLGAAIVLITHDLGVVADVADRVMVMYAGRVVERSEVDELFARPRHHYTVGLLGAVPSARVSGGEQRLREIPGLVPTLEQQPDACTFAARCPAADERCRSQEPPLAPAPQSSHEVACWHPAGTRPPGDRAPGDRAPGVAREESG